MKFNIEESKDGYRILKFDIDGKSKYLGSKYNQKREIDSLLEKFRPLTHIDNYIVFGISFGEHIQRLLEEIGETSKILIVEVNDEWIKFCNSDEKVKNILSDERVSIASNDSDVKDFYREYIGQMNVDNVKIGYYCGYENIYLDKLTDIYRVIRDESLRIISDKDTSLHFGDIWFDTFFGNLKYIAKGTEINKLENKYENKPAIIVSAGPSLSKNIEKLKGVDNALILTSGRTLQSLISLEIEPTLMGVVDPGENSYKLVKDYIDKVKCPLLFYEGSNNDVVKNHKGKKIFSSSNKFINDVFGEDIISLSGGGSIAHVLTCFAIYMGCNPIIFIGQDLAYTGDRGHAICAENPWEKLDFDWYKKENDIYVKDINGDLVRTSGVLNVFRVALEEIIKSFPTIKFINATEGGADIKGTDVKTLDEVIKTFPKEEIERIEKFLTSEDKTKILVEKLEDSLNIIDEYINKCKTGERVLKNLKADYYLGKIKEVNKNITILDNIDSGLKENLTKITMIDNILFDTMYKIENKDEFIITSTDNKEERIKKNFEKNEAIYVGLRRVCEITHKKIKDLIEELKEEV